MGLKCADDYGNFGGVSLEDAAGGGDGDDDGCARLTQASFFIRYSPLCSARTHAGGRGGVGRPFRGVSVVSSMRLSLWAQTTTATLGAYRWKMPQVLAAAMTGVRHDGCSHPALLKLAFLSRKKGKEILRASKVVVVSSLSSR